jgi:hypothetical protein
MTSPGVRDTSKSIHDISSGGEKSDLLLVIDDFLLAIFDE